MPLIPPVFVVVHCMQCVAVEYPESFAAYAEISGGSLVASNDSS